MDKQYVTVSEIEDYTLLNVVDSFESRITDWIIAMSNYVALQTNREWLADDTDYPVTRYFDGCGSSHLKIGEAVSIDSVAIGENYAESFEDITDYITYPYNSDVITKLIRKDDCFDRGIKNIKVVGNFGYAETVPADIRFAVTVLVAGIIYSQSNQDGEIESEKIGNYSVKYVTEKAKGDYQQALDIIKSRRIILL